MKIKYKLSIRWVPSAGTFAGILTLSLPTGPEGWELIPQLQAPDELLGEVLEPRWGTREEGFRVREIEVGQYPSSAAARGALRARLEGIVTLLRSVSDRNLVGSGQEWEEEGEEEV